MPRPIIRRTAALLGTALLLAACAGAPAATSPSSPADETPSPMATMEHTDSPSPMATESASAEPTEASDEGAEVQLQMSSFAPGLLTVQAGDEVTFINNSGLPHTVTHGTSGRAVEDPAFDEPIGDGATVTITFDEPGTYDITCKIHPEMQMSITVEG